MGKNKKEKKKGHGADKTAAKTERKAAKKARKVAKTAGEDDVAAVVAQLEAEESAKWRPLIELPDADVESGDCRLEFRPSPRSNFSWTANPRRSELYLFGGEQRLPGSGRLRVLNEHLVYRPIENRWIRLGGGSLPTPRCAHQAAIVKPSSGGGDHLFIFGGEYATPTESQFHHYDDLWSWTVKSRQWRKITLASGSPSPCPRSGHRMVTIKRPQPRLLVFGGFQDNGRAFRYLNDLWSFDMESRVWTEIRVAGAPPSPRSACLLFPLPEDVGLCLIGGYAKRTERRSEKGIVHTDCFTLSLQGKSSTATDEQQQQQQQPIWQSVKFSGQRPTPRCGVSGTTNPSTGRAYTFGGVFDIEQSDDAMTGVMFNELYQLDLLKQRWRLIDFNALTATSSGSAASASAFPAGLPCERINAGLAVLDDRLYLYGGIYEGDDLDGEVSGEKSRTLDDLHCLELKRPNDGWKLLLAPTGAGYDDSEECEEKEDSSSSSDEAADEGEEEREADSEDTPQPPPVADGETVDLYASRTDAYWSRAIGQSLRRCWPADDVTDPLVAKYARRAARDFYRQTVAD